MPSPEFNSQIACGIWLSIFFISGIVSPANGKVISNFPAMNAKFAVAGSLMIVYSIPSR